MEEKYSSNLSTAINHEFEDETVAPWIERNGFSHWAIASLWFVIAFVLFQLVGGIITGLLLLPELIEVVNAGGDIQKVFSENLNELFIGNTLSQLLIIGLASYLISKLHSPNGKNKEFLRVKTGKNLKLNTVIAILLLVSSWGVVAFLGWLNVSFFDWLVEIFPGLAVFKDMQAQMAEMIVGFIKSDYAIIYGLIYIALVPAVFEEIMFRGYIQRALEKSGGIWVGIIVSGLMFGAYHVQPSNFLPLSFLGIIFAYVTYISDSLIPAMVLHFINNGSQVIYGSLNPEFLEQSNTSELGLPWFMIVLSVIVMVGLLLLMHKLKTKSSYEPI